MSDTIPTHPGLEALADGFFMLDTEWRIAYWNAAAVRILGIARDRAVGRGLWSVVPASERALLEPKLRDAMSGREPAEFVIPHLPGCCRGHYSVRAVPIGGGGIAVHLRDATDETKLAERYSQLLESIRDAFVAVDSDGSISYINHVAERLLRLSRGDALGMRVWKLVPPTAPQIEACLRSALEDGMPRKLRRIPMDTGKPRGRFIDMWVHPLPGGGLSVLFQDVTRRVRREKDLSRYAAEADEANRAKGRFFAAVSHELRTPLNAIVGYTHLLTTDTYGDLPGGAVRAASRASVCAEHLAHLIDDLLLMTTAEIDRLPVTASPVVIADFLRTALEPVRQQAEAKGLRFGIEFEGDAPTVETDPARLRQLLLAVLANAIKFTDRGSVEVRVIGLASAPRAGQNAAGGAVAETNRGLRIRISDTGPGIPNAERERIFEAFEQLGDPSRSDSLSRGPGLGLTVAKRLALLLQGDLTLERSGDTGSVFCIDLPARLR